MPVAFFRWLKAPGDPTLYWIEPERRGILALDRVHVPRRLARVIRQEKFEVRVDSAYEAVWKAALPRAPGGATTWINRRIRELYAELFEMGYCHTVETWLDGRLVGGLYGVALGRAFFGESMFSYETDASKVALIHLWRGSAMAVFACWTPSSSPIICANSVPGRSAGRRSTGGLSGRFRAWASSAACQMTCRVPAFCRL